MSHVQPVAGPPAPEPDAPPTVSSAVPGGWTLARVGGVPVVIGGGWVVIALAMVALFGPRIVDELPQHGAWGYAVAAAYAVLLLVSVLVHEGSHAVAARLCGYRVNYVVADLMGGHTAYDATHTTPARSAVIAVVGPLSNGLLAVVGLGLLTLTQSGVGTLLIGAFAWTNGVVAVFNLLPGLPLDGGFLLEALVWGATGRRHLGLLVAGWAGRVVTLAAVAWVVALPLLQGERPSTITLVWVLLVAAFLWRGASAAISAGRLRHELAGVALRNVTRPVQLLPTGVTVARVLDERSSQAAVVLVTPQARALGYLDDAALTLAAREGDIATPADSCLRIQPQTWAIPAPSEPGAVDAVVAAMAHRGLSVVLLTDARGVPTGLVDAATIDDVLRARG